MSECACACKSVCVRAVWVVGMRSAISCCCPQRFLEPPQAPDALGETLLASLGKWTLEGWG